MSSPTLDIFFNRLGTTVTTGFLTLWITATLGFVVIEFLEPGWEIIDRTLCITLLAYLISRMIVACFNTKSDSIVYRLTTAHRHSRRGAFAVLLCACAWIYELFFKILVMAMMSFYSAVAFFAHLHPDFFDRLKDKVNALDGEIEYGYKPPTMSSEEFATAMKEFKEEVGFDPVTVFGWIPHRILLCCFALAWFSVATLALYILRLIWKSFKGAFGPASTPPAPRKSHVV